MNILYVAYYTAKRYLRNIMCVLFFTAAPLLMIYATTSGGGMTYEKLSAEFTEKIGYCLFDKGELAAQFSEVVKSSTDKSSIEFMNISSYDKGMEELKKGNIDSFIFIDKGASDDYSRGEKAEIKVFVTKAVSAAKTMVEGFVNNKNGIQVVLDMGITPVLSTNSRNMDVTVISSEGKMADNIDATVIANILLFLFYGAVLGSYSIINDVVKNTTIRFKCAPIRHYENITGKMLGNLCVMSLSTIVIILFSKYALEVNWDGNMLIIILTILLFLILVNNIGVIIAGFTRNIYLCGLIIFAVNFTLVYGVMAEAYAPASGSALDIGKVISPHYYAYEAIIGSIYSSSGADVGLSLVVLVTAAVMTTVMSFIVGRRRMG